MNFIHYQPPIKRSPPGSSRYKALKPSDPIDNMQRNLTTPERSDEWSAILLSSDHIEDLDLSGPAIGEPLDSCYNTEPNLSGIEEIDGDPLREPGAFLSGDHEEDKVFEAWLCDSGATHQETDTARLIGTIEDSSGYLVNTGDKAIQATSDPKLEESGEIPFKASIFPATSRVGVSAGIGTRNITNTAPSTCVGGSCDSSTDKHASNGSTWDIDTSPSDTSPNAIASAVEDYTKTNSSTDGPETQRWDATQADAMEERSYGRDGDSNHKDDVQSRSLKRQRPRSTIQKHAVRRRTKRHRFSSPLSSTEGTETDNETDTLNCASLKVFNTPKPRSTINPIISSVADPARTSCDQSSPMMVVYEQQSWEGMIIDERYMTQKRGRSRKQYLVRWKDSWVDYSHLPVPKALQSWKAGRAAKDTLDMQ